MTTCRNSLIPSVFISAVLVGGGDAFSTFQPVCMLPPNGTHFVRNPTARSSLSIIWTTATIVLLCTWSILHLNVPSIHSTRSFWKIFANKCLDSRIKLKWMLFMIILPEFLVGKALSNWQAARHFPGGDQNKTRTYLANMGYFVLEWDNPAVWTSVQQEVAAVLSTSRLLPYQKLNIERLKTKFWALNAWQWEELSRAGVAHLPDTPQYQLDRLDNGGILIKVLALIQGLYLVVELIARGVAGHPSTQLEVLALAFAMCSIITYLAYMSHPQNVEALHYIQAGNLMNQPTQVLIERLGEVGPLCLWTKWRGRSRFEPSAGPEPIPNDATHMGRDHIPQASRSGSRSYLIIARYGGGEDNPRNMEVGWIMYGICLGGLLFGPLHLLSAVSQFPTTGEATAWLWCCVIGTIVPVTSPLLGGFMPLFGDHSERRRIVTTLIWGILFLLYALSRLFIIVESIRSLFFQPPRAYANTWSSELLHW